MEQATTSSLEALKAFNSARECAYKGDYRCAVTFYEHAVELDPNFAQAYSGLAAMSGNADISRKAAQKAYDLRDRVSERERFRIDIYFQYIANGDMEQAIEIGKLFAKTYPDDFIAHDWLGASYFGLGQYEKALEELSEAHRLLPRATSYEPLINVFTALNRFQEAEELCDKAILLGMVGVSLHQLTPTWTGRLLSRSYPISSAMCSST